ncbi:MULTISPECIES: hypothetical protein [Pseudomonas]|uniref:Uncharacterized protein n=1 Tax=Pseudomonas lutea TaxID=243924 RepID=A0A9X8MH22_9PSED|nr:MULTISPECIES: hypothetical protein [Pseudomonas]SER35719.1 hypothetical protein SAMN05216409_11822 [Pseudomonas lutea]
MSRWPAVVVSYDRDARTCEIVAEGLTDGAGSHLIAEIEQSLGDRSPDTEIRILPGDPIWIDFLAGDPRYPIITGFRSRNLSNMIGTRHWEHENFTIIADETIVLKAGKSIRLEVGGSTFELTPESIAQVASANTMNGPLTQTGGDITSDGIGVQEHHHTEHDGPPTSAAQA